MASTEHTCFIIPRWTSHSNNVFDISKWSLTSMTHSLCLRQYILKRGNYGKKSTSILLTNVELTVAMMRTGHRCFHSFKNFNKLSTDNKSSRISNMYNVNYFDKINLQYSTLCPKLSEPEYKVLRWFGTIEID